MPVSSWSRVMSWRVTLGMRCSGPASGSSPAAAFRSMRSGRLWADHQHDWAGQSQHPPPAGEEAGCRVERALASGRGGGQRIVAEPGGIGGDGAVLERADADLGQLA